MGTAVGIALMVVGGLGLVARSVEFVRVTLPANYGSNPGFGCYETMVLPWFACGCAGAGLLLSSWRTGLGALVAGLLLLGFLGQLLSRVFSR